VIASGPILRHFGLWTPRATNECGSLAINERLAVFWDMPGSRSLDFSYAA
jgi:hypothetical protein